MVVFFLVLFQRPYLINDKKNRFYSVQKVNKIKTQLLLFLQNEKKSVRVWLYRATAKGTAGATNIELMAKKK